MWQRVWYQDEETGEWYSRREDDFGMTQEERDAYYQEMREYLRETEGWEP